MGINIEHNTLGEYITDIEDTHGHDFVDRNLQLLCKIYVAARKLIYSPEEYTKYKRPQ